MKDSDNNSHFAIAYCVAMTAGLALVLLIHSEAGPKLIECVRQWETLITGIIAVAAAIWAANKAYSGVQEQIQANYDVSLIPHINDCKKEISKFEAISLKIRLFKELNQNLIRIQRKSSSEFTTDIAQINYFINNQYAEEAYRPDPDILDFYAATISYSKAAATISKAAKTIRETNKARADLENALNSKSENSLLTNDLMGSIGSGASSIEASLSASEEEIDSEKEEITRQLNELMSKTSKKESP